MEVAAKAHRRGARTTGQQHQTKPRMATTLQQKMMMLPTRTHPTSPHPLQRTNRSLCLQCRASPQAHPSPQPATCPPCLTCRATSPHPRVHSTNNRPWHTIHQRAGYRRTVPFGMAGRCTVLRHVRRPARPRVLHQLRITRPWTRIAWVLRPSRCYRRPGKKLRLHNQARDAARLQHGGVLCVWSRGAMAQSR